MGYWLCCIVPRQKRSRLADESVKEEQVAKVSEGSRGQQDQQNPSETIAEGQPLVHTHPAHDGGQEGAPPPSGLPHSAQPFTFRDLQLATNNFRSANLLGEGGFGRVYKGLLEDSQRLVAVKQLDRAGCQGNQEFRVEVSMLSLLHHPHLVNLIGYCADGEQRLLVYEFMPLGCLEDHLHDLPPGREPLDWVSRMKVAWGAAQGLEYLHDKAAPPVIYRDFKSSNILLDHGFHPKLSDFGLAKLGPVGDKTHVSTRVMGTYGYCAPEYAMTGKLTTRSDVYSFGVVLLELITGRKAIDSSRPAGETNLVTWARPLFNDRRQFVKMVDPKLQCRVPIRGLYQALAVAAMCLQQEAANRPLVADVVMALSHLANPSTTDTLILDHVESYRRRRRHQRAVRDAEAAGLEVTRPSGGGRSWKGRENQGGNEGVKSEEGADVKGGEDVGVTRPSVGEDAGEVVDEATVEASGAKGIAATEEESVEGSLNGGETSGWRHNQTGEGSTTQDTERGGREKEDRGASPERWGDSIHGGIRREGGGGRQDKDVREESSLDGRDGVEGDECSTPGSSAGAASFGGHATLAGHASGFANNDGVGRRHQVGDQWGNEGDAAGRLRRHSLPPSQGRLGLPFAIDNPRFGVHGPRVTLQANPDEGHGAGRAFPMAAGSPSGAGERERWEKERERWEKEREHTSASRWNGPATPRGGVSPVTPRSGFSPRVRGSLAPLNVREGEAWGGQGFRRGGAESVGTSPYNVVRTPRRTPREEWRRRREASDRRAGGGGGTSQQAGTEWPLDRYLSSIDRYQQQLYGNQLSPRSPVAQPTAGGLSPNERQLANGGGELRRRRRPFLNRSQSAISLAEAARLRAAGGASPGDGVGEWGEPWSNSLPEREQHGGAVQWPDDSEEPISPALSAPSPALSTPSPALSTPSPALSGSASGRDLERVRGQPGIGLPGQAQGQAGHHVRREAEAGSVRQTAGEVGSGMPMGMSGPGWRPRHGHQQAAHDEQGQVYHHHRPRDDHPLEHDGSLLQQQLSGQQQEHHHQLERAPAPGGQLSQQALPSDSSPPAPRGSPLRHSPGHGSILSVPPAYNGPPPASDMQAWPAVGPGASEGAAYGSSYARRPRLQLPRGRVEGEASLSAGVSSLSPTSCDGLSPPRGQGRGVLVSPSLASTRMGPNPAVEDPLEEEDEHVEAHQHHDRESERQQGHEKQQQQQVQQQQQQQQQEQQQQPPPSHPLQQHEHGDQKQRQLRRPVVEGDRDDNDEGQQLTLDLPTLVLPPHIRGRLLRVPIREDRSSATGPSQVSTPGSQRSPISDRGHAGATVFGEEGRQGPSPTSVVSQGSVPVLAMYPSAELGLPGSHLPGASLSPADGQEVVGAVASRSDLDLGLESFARLQVEPSGRECEPGHELSKSTAPRASQAGSPAASSPGADSLVTSSSGVSLQLVTQQWSLPAEAMLPHTALWLSPMHILASISPELQGQTGTVSSELVETRSRRKPAENGQLSASAEGCLQRRSSYKEKAVAFERALSKDRCSTRGLTDS